MSPGASPRSEDQGWSLKRFHACQPLEPFARRIHLKTEQQRPKRLIKRDDRDPLAPKWVLPMLATNFPQTWDRNMPGINAKKSNIAGVAAPAPAAAATAEDEWEEEPKGYTWLQRKGRDGKTLFPYSLVSHRAFLQSQVGDELKAKALAFAPMRMTEPW